MVKLVFDCHCHTKEGSVDGKIKLMDTIKLLKLKGYDGMIVTDHNSYKAYDNLKDFPNDFVVLRGVEYDSMDGGHLLIILPSEMKYNIFEYRGMYVKDVINIVHTLGGIVGPAHPYEYNKLGFCNIKHENKDELLNSFDFIETFNGSLDKRNFILSDYVAREYNKPCFGGSDSHSISKVGYGKTVFPVDILSEDDLIEAVKMGDYSSFEATGTYFYRKHERLHSTMLSIGGFIYSEMNHIISGNVKKKTNAFKDAIED